MVSRMASLQVAAEKGNPLIELLQTSTKFKEWLASKNPEEVVGHSYDCYHDPIAYFIKANGEFSAVWIEEGYVNADVNEDYGWILTDPSDFDEEEPADTVPAWVNKFEEHLTHLDRNLQITASYALLLVNLLEEQARLKPA